jgi:hypothetical protein
MILRGEGGKRLPPVRASWDRSVTAQPGDHGAGQRRREGHDVTGDSAFKKQVRARVEQAGRSGQKSKLSVDPRDGWKHVDI